MNKRDELIKNYGVTALENWKMVRDGVKEKQVVYNPHTTEEHRTQFSRQWGFSYNGE